ncbi:DUF302 domain-containing protein [Nocardia sp. NPDC049707]|uniref:DUF302 domain-containing protein n=1 Tax=Nocardia sp. NPDC049707 TaxID=3154735 RepID=UPI003423E5E6
MQSVTVDHPSRRLLIALPQPYEEARAAYETLVPEVDPSRFAAARSWPEVVDLARLMAPHGFLRYYRADLAPTMAGSDSTWQATQYLMGNHTIAERMFRHDPAVMLHAPLRTLLYIDPAGDTRLAVDQPSLLFDSYDNPDIAAVGRELDALLSTLVTLLGGTMPGTFSQRPGTAELPEGSR